MANPEHVVIIRRGSDAWNRWREENPEVVPSLNNADLQGVDLQGADLVQAEMNQTGINSTIQEKPI